MYKGTFKYADDFLKSLSNGANYDAETAIAELIDNSIGAGAEEIRINFNDGRFSISDRGESCGMDEKTLKRNFFYGGASSSKTDSRAAGKFGIGGKTGIIALIGKKDATDIEIQTHKAGYKPVYARWPFSQTHCGYFEIEVMSDDSYPYGTTIEFGYENDIDESSLRKFIGVTYCWALSSGVNIFVNGNMIVPSDPLYRYNRHVVENGIFSEKKFKIGREAVTVSAVSFSDGKIIPQEELNGYDRDGRRCKTVLTANRSGIYVRTGGRYYTLGNNFDKVMGVTAHASLDGLRVEVDIPKKLWDLIGITWNKGREITSFKKIAAFQECGLYGYIGAMMRKFSKGKHFSDGQKTDIINRRITKEKHHFGGTEVTVCAVNSGRKDRPFAELRGRELTFDISSAPSTNKNEILGMVRGISSAVNALFEKGHSDMAQMVVNAFNSKRK